MSVVCKVVVDNEAPVLYCFAFVPRLGDHVAFQNSIANFDALPVVRVVHFARDLQDEKAPSVLIYLRSDENRPFTGA